MVSMAIVQQLTVLISITVFTAATLQSQNRSEIYGSSYDLFIAIVRGNESEAIRLIENGADLNATWGMKQGILAIQVASEQGLEKVVDILLNRGSDVNVIDYASGSFRRPIHYAALQGHEKVVEILIKNGCLVNPQDKDGLTPLHYAALRGYEKVAETILRNGGSPGLKDQNGMTPRDLAHEEGYPNIIEIFDKLSFGQPEDFDFKRLATAKLQQMCKTYSSEDILLPYDDDEEERSSEFPWMVRLVYLDEKYKITFRCGGTIISERFVLTAAHCVRVSNSPVAIRMGSLNLIDGYNRNYFIQEIIRHANYSLRLKKNDIALIRVSKEIVFNPNIRPACLETDQQDLNAEVRLNIMSWGEHFNGLNYEHNQLRKLEVVTMPLFKCNKMYLDVYAHEPALRNGIIESQYCAYDPNVQSYVVHGDSGAPLQIMANGTSHVVGIASFGVPSRSWPTIYTRVAHYTEWIVEHVWPDPQDRIRTLCSSYNRRAMMMTRGIDEYHKNCCNVESVVFENN